MVKLVNTEFPNHLVPVIHRDFLRLYNSLVIFWGSRDFNEFMSKTMLMTSDRTDRQGFSKPVMIELFNIQSEHIRLFPQFNSTDPWELL